MSLAESLRDTGKRLQQAVAARTFPKADALVREYRRCLETLPEDAPNREEILRESAELFESLRRATLAARASAAAQFRDLPTAKAQYGAPREAPRHSWEMTG
jgi:hypothetical protein